MIRRALIAIPVLAALALTGWPSGGASAQTPDPDAPKLVYQSLKDGDVVSQPLFIIQLCFDAPINIKDLDKGGDFAFEVTQPDGVGLGHRDIFQPDAYGVAIQPGNPVGETTGEWTFKYRVTSPDALHSTSDEIKYTVDPSGEERPRATPPPCVAAGGTATVSPTPLASGSAAPTNSAAPTATLSSPTARPSGSPAASPTASPAPQGDDGGPDILKLALLTIGAAGVAAVVALIGYFIRRGIGFDWHKPGPGDSNGRHH